MVFSSIEFLFLFLPTVVTGYYLLPRRARNGWLLISSLLFYAWGEPSFVFLMMASIAFNFVVALWLDPDSVRSGRFRKAMFVFGLSGNILFLGVYKYLNFCISVLRDWFPFPCGAIPQTSILLPIGISFFTFQAISYLVDVYRGTVGVQRNPARLALYIALFPQLIAGPIVRYSTVCGQIAGRRETWRKFSYGVFRFVVGLNKKVLLANTMAEVSDHAFGAVSPDAGLAWLGLIAFGLQMYFDFGGYSDMAIGLGQMFGFRFQENFRYPYIAGTISEFWRRWHISLTTWFRDYVYFPLGGSRVGKGRWIFNLALVWTLTGIWHGADWTFVLWGPVWFALLLVERLLKVEKRLASGTPLLRIAYRVFTILAILLCPVLIRADSMTVATRYFEALFGAGPRFNGAETWFWFREYWYAFLVSLVGCLPLWKRYRMVWFRAFGIAAQLPLLVVSVMSLVARTHNPFIYFNF